MTVVELCNNALCEITHDRVITSLTDGSAEALRCALFWPRARRAVLAAHPWSFLSLTAAPGTLGAGAHGYTKSYPVPAGALTVNGLTDAGSVSLPFIVRNAAVYCSTAPALIHYTADSEIPDNWPAAIQDAVIAELANRLARVMAGSKTVIEACTVSAGTSLKAALDAESRLAGVTQATADTILDLCNNALAGAGFPRDITSLTDGSREASLCTRLYPRARKACLASHPWTFAALTAAPGTAGTAAAGFTNAYTAPAGAITINGATAADGSPVPFQLRAGFIQTQGPAATISYTADDATPDDWPPMFKDAVIAELAARLTRGRPASAEGIAATAEIAKATIIAAIEADKRLAGLTQSSADTLLDLANNALAQAGSDRDLTSLADGSREAALCTRLLPRARQAVIAAHPWSCALATEDAWPTEDVPLPGYLCTYDAPADTLSVTAMLDAAGDPVAFTLRDGTLHTRADAATISYTRDLPDPALWPPLLRDAIIGDLALRLARAIPELRDNSPSVAAETVEALHAARRADTPSRDPGTRNPYLEART